MTQDWTKISGDLERLLKLRSFVFAMKLFERLRDLYDESDPKGRK